MSQDTIELTKQEFGLLIERLASRTPRPGSRASVVFGGLAGTISIGCCSCSGDRSKSWFGTLTFSVGIVEYELNKQRDLAIGLIQKFQDDPHQGRRVIDTALLHKLPDSRL